MWSWMKLPNFREDEFRYLFVRLRQIYRRKPRKVASHLPEALTRTRFQTRKHMPCQFKFRGMHRMECGKRSSLLPCRIAPLAGFVNRELSFRSATDSIPEC